MKTLIGYAIAAEAFTHHVPQEFAGARESVAVPAGRYPVTMRRDGGQVRYVIELEGVSVYRAWFGSNVRIEETPEPRRPLESIRGYELAYAVVQGKAWGGVRFELEPGFTAELIKFEYDGEPRETAGIYHDGKELPLS